MGSAFLPSRKRCPQLVSSFNNRLDARIESEGSREVEYPAFEWQCTGGGHVDVSKCQETVGSSRPRGVKQHVYCFVRAAIAAGLPCPDALIELLNLMLTALTCSHADANVRK
jgi:hypothetical protein